MSSHRSSSSNLPPASARSSDEDRASASSPTGSPSAKDPNVPRESRSRILSVISEETDSACATSSSNLSVERRHLDSGLPTVITENSGSSASVISCSSVSLGSVRSDDSSNSMMARPTTVPRMDSYDSVPTRSPSPLPTNQEPMDQNPPVAVVPQGVGSTNYQRAPFQSTSTHQRPLNFVDVDSQISDYYQMLHTDTSLTNFGDYYEEAPIECTGSDLQADNSQMNAESPVSIEPDVTSIDSRMVEPLQDAPSGRLAELENRRRRRRASSPEPLGDSSEFVPVVSHVVQASRGNERSLWDMRRSRTVFQSYRRNAPSSRSRSRSTSPVGHSNQEDVLSDEDYEMSQGASSSTTRPRYAERFRRASILSRTRNTLPVESSSRRCTPSDEKFEDMQTNESSTSVPGKSTIKRRRLSPEPTCPNPSATPLISVPPPVPSTERVALNLRESHQSATEPQTVEQSRSSPQRPMYTPAEVQRMVLMMPRGRSLGRVEPVPSLEELERRMANMATPTDAYVMVEDELVQPVEHETVPSPQHTDSSIQNVPQSANRGVSIRIAEAFADEQDRFVEFYIQNCNREKLEILLGSYYNRHLPLFISCHGSNAHHQNNANGDLNSAKTFLHFEVDNHHVLSELLATRQQAQAHMEWLVQEVQSGRLELSQ
ncbi:unnamed protein product [Caenorhabditis brenneri]